MYALFRRWDGDGSWQQVPTKPHPDGAQGHEPLAIVLTAGHPATALAGSSDQAAVTRPAP